jgi:hypothetical protein
MNLGAGGNSATFDAAPNYFENEDVGIPLLFFTSFRPGGLGNLDTYISELASDGSFGPAVLSPNSTAHRVTDAPTSGMMGGRYSSIRIALVQSAWRICGLRRGRRRLIPGRLQ